MNLSPKYFFSRTICYRIGANGPTQTARGYGYESADKLYDVNLYAEGVQYRTNGVICNCTPIHAAIVKHFDLDID